MSVNRLCRWILAGTVLLLLAAVTPAGAHSTLDKQSVPADTDVELVVQAPVEEAGAYNERIVVEVPDGFTVRPCVKPPEGFRCFLRPAANPPRTLITWERTEEPDVTVPFATDELPFRTRSHSKPGLYAFKISQFYSNGAEAHWDGPPGSENPAPVLEVTPDPGATTTTTSPPSTGSTTTVPEPAATTSTTPPPSTPPGGPGSPSADGPADPSATTTTIRAAIDVIDGGGDDEDGPGWVLALTGAALVGGAGALAARAAGRRRLIDAD